MEGYTEEQMEGNTEGHTEGHMEGHTERHTEGHTTGHTEHTDVYTEERMEVIPVQSEAPLEGNRADPGSHEYAPHSWLSE